MIEPKPILIDEATAAAVALEADRLLAGACRIPASLLPELHELSRRAARLAHQADVLRSDLTWACGPQPAGAMGRKLVEECAADVQMATRLLGKVARRLESRTESAPEENT